MRPRLLAVLAALLPLAALAADAPPHVLAYYDNDPDTIPNLRDAAAGGFLNQIATDVFRVDPDGNVTGAVPAEALSIAKAGKVAAFATVSNFRNGGFDGPGIHAVLTSPEKVERFAAGLVAVATANGFDGINLDLEGVPKGDRGPLSAAVAVVALRVHAAGKLLVVSVPATTADDPRNGWSGAFDFAAIGTWADLIQLMTYSQHGPWSAAGAVAALDWTEACVKCALATVPPAKVSLGIAAFGCDWDLVTKKGEQIPWKQVAALATEKTAIPRWDEASSTPTFVYDDKAGHHHAVWHEDRKSLAMKTALVAKYHLAGVSVWSLGHGNRAFWETLQAAMRDGAGS